MAFSKAKSRKCPVCLGCMPSKVEEIDDALKPILADVKATGEVPKARDSRFDLVAHSVGIAPHSLRYHLKECLLDLEIQDQRFQELKDLTEAIATAKQEYSANPSQANANAYTMLITQWRGLADDIEGQVDPEVTVEFLVANVLNALSRKMLASSAEEQRTLRESLDPLLDRNHRAFVDAQLKSGFARTSAAIRDGLDDGLKALCEYYKVELEAKARMRALESGTDSPQPLFKAGGQSSEDDSVVH